MMTAWLRLCFLLACTTLVLGWPSVIWSEDDAEYARSVDDRTFYYYEEDTEENREKHANLRTCYAAELGMMVPSGTAWPTATCEEAKCTNGTVWGFGCEPVPKLPMHSRCRIEPENLSLQFPHCCPRIRCPGYPKP